MCSICHERERDERPNKAMDPTVAFGARGSSPAVKPIEPYENFCFSVWYITS